MSDGIEERGVHNPKVIDLIARDSESGDVVLTMVEPREWGVAPDQIRQVEEKFNSYLQYILGGNLEHDYPQYAGASVRIQLECVQVPGDTEVQFFDAIVKFAAQENIEFVVLVCESG
jgi:hypothetical protein